MTRSLRDRPLVVGVGNVHRGDDAAGPIAARALRRLAARLGIDVVEHRGDGAGLLDLWTGRDHAILVDAFEGSPPGRVVHVPDAAREGALLPDGGDASTHGIGPAGAIALARRLDRLPARLEIYAIAGDRFGVGDPPHHAVDAAARRVARTLADRLSNVARPACPMGT